MFNAITISKLLEKTNEQLSQATELLVEAYSIHNSEQSEVSQSLLNARLADAVNKFRDWSAYYNRYTELIDDEKEQSQLLVIENNNLKKQINDKDAQIVNLMNIIKASHNKDAQIANLMNIIKASHNNDNERIELAEAVEAMNSALKLINENAKTISTATHMKNRHIGSGDKHPAYRQDVDSKALIDDYNSGKFNLKELAEKYGMTSPGLRDRLIKLGVYKSVYKSHK